MDFSFSSIFAGLLFGVWGMYFVKRAKSQAHWPSLFVGIGLMIYPYFVENVYLVWGLGVVLIFLGYSL